MKPKHLHIVSFDIPWPDNYGGVIDVYHKLRHLHAMGWQITLHCFSYGRKSSRELEKFCFANYYYPRHTNKSYLLSKLPYIVITRNHEALVKNLCADQSPILFEGIHSTFLLADPALRNRKTIVRTHNIEHEYYFNQAQLEGNPFRKLYYLSEASKLKRYERVLEQAGQIAAISTEDYAYFNHQYHHTFLLPAFHAYDQVTTLTGRGDFCLYHGNLSVAENHEAAMWILDKVMPFLDLPLIIAGQKPRKELRQKIANQKNVRLIQEPDADEMSKLIHQAQVHILPAFQSSGIKLKLLHALFCGRHIVTNGRMAGKNIPSELYHLAESPESFASLIQSLFEKKIDQSEINKRVKILSATFSNTEGAKKLSQLLESDW